MSKHLIIGLAIATAGRREVLSETLRDLANQERAPDLVAICPAAPDDVDPAALADLPFPVELVEGPLGSCAQRNAIIDRFCGAWDVMLFMDDDFVMAPDYLKACEAVFLANEDLAVLTGRVIADGVLGPGIDVASAKALIAADDQPRTEALRPVHNGYGCNMAASVAAINRGAVRFDERLPFYGWLEDVDFSRRLAPFGRIVSSDLCRGVHMGTKRGRTSGLRFGYSQVANPYYLWRKGTLSGRRAASQMGRNLAANLLKSARPEAWVDRRGRVAGNLRAIADMALGRLDPTRIRQLIR